MKLGSLFDGSGTCPLAASAVGIIPAWASEIEPFPNSVAFPCMLYIMEGVQEVLAERYLDNLFGGDTAEP